MREVEDEVLSRDVNDSNDVVDIFFCEYNPFFGEAGTDDGLTA